MRRVSRSHALVVAVAVAMVLTPAVAAALPAQTPTSNGTDAPGERFAGVVGVQGAEVDGAVEDREFGAALAAVEDNASKARVVADRVSTLRERLADLRERRADLRTAVDNGTLTHGQYRSRIATVAAEVGTVTSQLNRSEAAAVALPETARREAGLNLTAVRDLRRSASDLRGGEVSRIARSVAGPGVGKGMPAGNGPPAGVPGAGTPHHGPGNGGPGNQSGPPGGTDYGGPGNQSGPPGGTDRGGQMHGPADGNRTVQPRG
jgi:hypothetical protein